MSIRSLSRASVAGFSAGIAGMVTGGFLGWTVGYFAMVEPLANPQGHVMFLLSMLLLPFGLIAPLTWFVYLRDQFEDPLKRWMAAILGNVAVVSFAGGMAYLGVFQALGITTSMKAIALFDGIAGATFGGLLVGRWTTRRRTKSEGWEDDAGAWEEDDDGW